MSANSSSVTPLHRRPNRPETPQYASVSPGRRSRQRTTAAENRTEVQTHGEIGARFLRNRPEVAATAAVDNHLATLGLGFLSQPPKKPTEPMRLEPRLDLVYYENGPDLRHAHAIQASQSAHDHGADLFFVLHHAS